MPFYPNKNILFIHIPKTGGTNIEDNLKLQTKQVLWTDVKNGILPAPFDNVSLQHQYYNTIFDFQNLLNIKINTNTKVFAVVRNPYDRIISDLFWFKLITKDSTPSKIYSIIRNQFLNSDYFDNHNKPQFNYVVDANGVIHPNIKIFKCENLNEENEKLSKFLNININIKNNKANKDYSKYLNKHSILLINRVYEKDFEMFNYNKKTI